MSPTVVRLLALLVVVGLACLAGAAVRRRQGRALAVPDRGEPAERLEEADLGTPLGARATLLQISAPVCAPCRAARRVLSALADAVPGVRHVELDAEQHLDLVRRLGVLRTPTVLVLDDVGRVVARSSGAPTRAQAEAALAHAGLGPAAATAADLTARPR